MNGTVFYDSVLAVVVIYVVAFGTFERPQEEVSDRVTSQQRCSAILLEELRKALTISVSFSYEPRKPIQIAARLVIWLQNIEEVLLLGLTSRFSNWIDEDCTQNCS